MAEPQAFEIALDGSSLTLEDLDRVLDGAPVAPTISPTALERVRASRRVVEAALASGRVVYGVNTGFGRLCDRRIPAERILDLQRNLVRSHAAGVGEPLADPVARAALLLRANALAKGFSGVRPETLQAILDLLAKDVIPVCPERGSVGASGDLAPLAHLALALLGEGEATWRGERLPAREALRRAGLTPVTLEAKEGLALINGTQVMTALGADALRLARRAARAADVAGAMTLDALLGTDVAFDERIHATRPHPGQAKVARNLRRLIAGSPLRASHRDCPKVQDAYSLRCMPQIHGAARDAIDYAAAVLERELNAATDNPLVFAETAEVLSGGNFHGQPVAIALDLLKIALCTLGNCSERRIERLVNPDLSGLPPFLAGEEGLESGLMIAQVTAAALASESKVLAHPASADSIPTSANTEDHVSMGLTAAWTARAVAQNVSRIVGIELIAAGQALELRRPLETSEALRAARATLRDRVPALDGDRPLAPDIEAAAALVRSGAAVAAAESAAGPLD